MKNASSASSAATFRTRKPGPYKRCDKSGRALILSVHKGRRTSNPKDDAATELQNSKEALSALGYEVDAVVDPTKEQMERKLREYRDSDWSTYGSVVVCLMAHGGQHSGMLEITAADGKHVKVPALCSIFAPMLF